MSSEAPVWLKLLYTGLTLTVFLIPISLEGVSVINNLDSSPVSPLVNTRCNCTKNFTCHNYIGDCGKIRDNTVAIRNTIITSMVLNIFVTANLIMAQDVLCSVVAYFPIYLLGFWFTSDENYKDIDKAKVYWFYLYPIGLLVGLLLSRSFPKLIIDVTQCSPGLVVHRVLNMHDRFYISGNKLILLFDEKVTTPKRCSIPYCGYCLCSGDDENATHMISESTQTDLPMIDISIQNPTMTKHDDFDYDND